MFINDLGIIEVAFIGPQTHETMETSLNAMYPLANQLVKAGQPVNFLFDYGKMGRSTLAANQRAMHGMRELTFHKMAGINAPPVIRFVTNAIARATGDSHRARHFRDRREAVRWLIQSGTVR